MNAKELGILAYKKYKHLKTGDDMWYRGHMIESVGPTVWVTGPLLPTKRLIPPPEDGSAIGIAKRLIDELIKVKGVKGQRYD
jgi:hypothetical protein